MCFKSKKLLIYNSCAGKLSQGIRQMTQSKNPNQGSNEPKSSNDIKSDRPSVGDDVTLGDEPAKGSASIGDGITHGQSPDKLHPRFNQPDINNVDLNARYTIESELGKGGMGRVFLATDKVLNRKVAIKRILGKGALNSVLVNRFLNEAQAIAALNHPNIVQIYDYGRAKDGPFLIMEYVDGFTLLELCREGAVPVNESIDLISQICDGLGKAHAANIIHRDIKPANILLTKDRVPKLTDFGLAKDEATNAGMTVQGAVMGTLDFMSPEQSRDATQVDTRSDLWSLAATFYQLVTGKSPKIINFRELPKSLHRFLEKALKHDKESRYQTAEEFKEALNSSGLIDFHVFDLDEGDCPSCGIKNPIDRRFCRNPECTASLLVPCLNCSAEIPLYERVCNSCGATQAELVKSKGDDLNLKKAKSIRKLEEGYFDAAIRGCGEIGDINDLRFQSYAKWAKEFLLDVEHSRKREFDFLAKKIDEAKDHDRNHDYEGAIDVLEKILPPSIDIEVPKHETTVRALKTEIENKLQQKKRLRCLIEDCLKNKKLDGLLSVVLEFRELNEPREDLDELVGKLRNRESKIIKRKKRRLREAQLFFDLQQYEECRQKLEKIEKSLRDKEFEDLFQQVNIKLRLVKELREEIASLIPSDQKVGLLELVEKYLELNGNDVEILELQEDLVGYFNQRKTEVALRVKEARGLRRESRFQEALDLLNQIPEHELGIEEVKLQDELGGLARSRAIAVYSLNTAMATAGSEIDLTAVDEYFDDLCQKQIVDAEVEQLRIEVQSRIDAARAKEIRRIRRNRILIVGITLFLISVGIGTVKFVQAKWLADEVDLAIKTGDFDRAISLDPNNQQTLELRKKAISIALERGDFRGVLRIDPENEKGMAIERQSKVESALAARDFDRALALDPGNNEIIKLKAIAISEAKRKGDFDEALRIDPNDLDALRMKKDDAIKVALARGNFKEVLRLDPSNSEGLEMERLSNIESAIKLGDYRKALRLDPSNERALGLEKDDKIRKALLAGDFQKALSIDPNNREALALKERTKKIVGLMAAGDFAKALELDPDNKDALLLRQVFEKVNNSKIKCILKEEEEGTYFVDTKGNLLKSFDGSGGGKWFVTNLNQLHSPIWTQGKSGVYSPEEYEFKPENYDENFLRLQVFWSVSTDGTKLALSETMGVVERAITSDRSTKPGHEYERPAQYLRIIDTASGVTTKRFEDIGYGKSIWLPNSTRIAILKNRRKGVEDRIKIFDTKNGNQVGIVGNKTVGAICDFAVNEDGSRICTAGANVQIWNVDDGKCLHNFGPQSGKVASVAFSADDTLIAGITDEALVFWDAQSGQCLKTISVKKNQGADAGGIKVLFSPDGGLLATIKASRTSPEFNPIIGRRVLVDSGVIEIWDLAAFSVALRDYWLLRGKLMEKHAANL